MKKYIKFIGITVEKMFEHTKLIAFIIFSITFISVTVWTIFETGKFWGSLVIGILACLLLTALLCIIDLILGAFFVNFKCLECGEINLFAREQYGVAMSGTKITGGKCRQCGEMFDTAEFEY